MNFKKMEYWTFIIHHAQFKVKNMENQHEICNLMMINNEEWKKEREMRTRL
jgi:hypothetical protein